MRGIDAGGYSDVQTVPLGVVVGEVHGLAEADEYPVREHGSTGAGRRTGFGSSCRYNPLGLSRVG